MAFWEDWEIDWPVFGISAAIWAICGLILFKMPMMFGSIESIKLFGLPFRIMMIIIWVIALPLSYPLTMLIFRMKGLD